mgnify:CR=1 FL=1
MITVRQILHKPSDKDLYALTIHGEPASKANARRLVQIHGRIVPIKSKKAINYSKDFNLQCPEIAKLYEEDLAIAMKILYQSKRPDLDESLILDLLQGKVYKNDRSIKLKHVVWGLDRECPRTLMVIGPLEKQEVVINTFNFLVEEEKNSVT